MPFIDSANLSLIRFTRGPLVKEELPLPPRQCCGSTWRLCVLRSEEASVDERLPHTVGSVKHRTLRSCRATSGSRPVLNAIVTGESKAVIGMQLAL